MRRSFKTRAKSKTALAPKTSLERRAADASRRPRRPKVSLLGAKDTWIVSNIGCLLTMDQKLGEGVTGVIKNAAVAVRSEKIIWVGSEANLPPEFRESEGLDADGALVTPGLIDCHTHLVFSGSRSGEFFQRLAGETYESIAQKGGGIVKTVAATRESYDQDLVAIARDRLDHFLSYGVTTVEAKSGYGLSLKDEMRILQISASLGHDVDVIPTFMGAHAVPLEYRDRREKYVELIVEEMLPAIHREKLSQICDVFCDEAGFTPEESLKILTAAKERGFQLKVHADQLAYTGGGELAAKVRALSADHLEHVSDVGVKALAKSEVTAVLLPTAVMFLGKRTYPPARKLLDAGVPVALATDFNPGTSPTENLPLVMTLAASELKMTADEIWVGVTVNAARATGLTDRGFVRAGSLADLVVWDAEVPEDVPYQFGAPRVRWVFKRGDTVWNGSRVE